MACKPPQTQLSRSDETDCGTRILVVDDNEVSLEVLSSGLANAGIEVQSAANGESVGELLTNAIASGHPFHVVILDWNLPGRSGLHFARMIRAMQLESMPSIVCLTSRDISEIPAADHAMFDLMIDKPIDTNSLKSAVLRLRNTHQDKTTDTEFPSDGDNQLHSKLAGMKALIVDDDRVSVRLAELILGSTGVSSQTCSNGKEAVKFMLSDQPFDFVLLDIEMPELDGIGTINILRNMPKRKHIKIFVVTAHALDREIQKIRQYPVDGILTKPYTAKQLVTFLESHLWGNGNAPQDQGQDPLADQTISNIREQLVVGDPLVREAVDSNSVLLKNRLSWRFTAFERAVSNYDFHKATVLLDDRGSPGDSTHERPMPHVHDNPDMKAHEPEPKPD